MKYTGIKEDEIFVGNFRVEKDLSYLQGVDYRIGDQALDLDGKNIDPKLMLPLFVKKSSEDKYDRIMTRRFQAIK